MSYECRIPRILQAPLNAIPDRNKRTKAQQRITQVLNRVCEKYHLFIQDFPQDWSLMWWWATEQAPYAELHVDQVALDLMVNYFVFKYSNLFTLYHDTQVLQGYVIEMWKQLRKQYQVFAPLPKHGVIQELVHHYVLPRLKLYIFQELCQEKKTTEEK